MRLTYTLLVVSLHKINMLVSFSAPLNTRPSVRSSERQRIFLQRRCQGGQSEFWRSRRRWCERTVRRLQRRSKSDKCSNQNALLLSGGSRFLRRRMKSNNLIQMSWSESNDSQYAIRLERFETDSELRKAQLHHVCFLKSLQGMPKFKNDLIWFLTVNHLKGGYNAVSCIQSCLHC